LVLNERNKTKHKIKEEKKETNKQTNKNEKQTYTVRITPILSKCKHALDWFIIHD